jgi:hypothetical protein
MSGENVSFKAKSKMAEGRKKDAQRIQRQISRKGLSKVNDYNKYCQHINKIVIFSEN